MAGRRVAAARHRSLYRLRRAHPRSQNRRSRAHPCACARRLRYRRAGLEENACATHRAAQSSGPIRWRARAHPRADWACDRSGIAIGDRRRHHGRDHRRTAPVAGEELMKFGAVPVGEAEGSVAVHSIRQGGLVLKKGTLIGRDEIAALKAAGIEKIVVARIEPGDVSEDAAAAGIAAALAGEGVHVERAFTGRANLFAESAGGPEVDRDAVARRTLVHEYL